MVETNTFPEEAKYQDLEYARRAYRIFTDNLKRSVTTRACIFGTIHRDATLLLMDQLEQSGLVTYVGKVNMDRNCPDYLREESAEESGIQTVEWIKDVLHKKYQNTMPILTPRFTPSCSDELMENLKKIQMLLPDSGTVTLIRKSGRDCLGEGALPVVGVLRGCL